MSILFYKRPDHVSKEGGPMTAASCQRYAEMTSGKSSIPPSLSFERVMGNKTMPPCSLQDFLDYLIYVAHDAENLQFYLWVQDYKRRFNALSESEKALSPEWKVDDIHAAPDLRKPGSNSIKSTGEDVLDKDMEEQYLANLKKIAARKSSRPPTPPAKDIEITALPALSSPPDPVTIESTQRWKSITDQPFRDEISQIITHYLLPSSPRELNLSHKARAALLHALHRTTHPSALSSIEDITCLTLRHHAHPNFIRWSLCNGNKPRVFFLRSMAVAWLILFTLSTLLLILSSKPRWFRIALAPVLWVGMTNLIAAARGLCVLLHRLHTREIHPWELDSARSSTPALNKSDAKFAEELAGGHRGDAGSYSSKAELFRSSASLTAVPSERASLEVIDLEARPAAPAKSVSLMLSPFGPGNTFEGEEWVRKWGSMGYWQRIRLRKVWVKEEGLRLMQNKIVRQAELWALITTVLVEIGVVFCPVVSVY
ncbi:MAG: hypothetical protein MMC23_001575 [Stictis urceolatum]|nr:hypothetical protein [Stictis urceolata]